ncbi:MAG: NfeD family protein [Cetobacterium sp.]|nr:NfeD family protein [Cetobacterium sp.]
MIIWFLIGLGFLGIELLNFGLISIWFAIGAFITMFFTNLSLLYQFYIFVGTSVFSLILIRKASLKLLKGKSSTVDRIKNSRVKIIEIKPDGNYSVYLEGKYWNCISKDILKVGELAKVEDYEGNKLILKKIKEKE